MFCAPQQDTERRAANHVVRGKVHRWYLFESLTGFENRQFIWRWFQKWSEEVERVSEGGNPNIRGTIKVPQFCWDLWEAECLPELSARKISGQDTIHQVELNGQGQGYKLFCNQLPQHYARKTRGAGVMISWNCPAQQESEENHEEPEAVTQGKSTCVACVKPRFKPQHCWK